MGLGPGEVLFIILIALVLFGPEKVPGLARKIGEALREFRSATGELTEELRRGLEDTPTDQDRTGDAERRRRSIEERRPGPRE